LVGAAALPVEGLGGEGELEVGGAEKEGRGLDFRGEWRQG